MAQERREHVDFLHRIEAVKEVGRKEKEVNDKQLTRLRDHLLEHHSLTYGYIDQPDRLLSEIDMAIDFTQLNSHLDRLLNTTALINSEVTKHNRIISQIETQAMESGDLLTDNTLLAHHSLGTSPSTPPRPMTNSNLITQNIGQLGVTSGQKILLNSVL